MFLRNISIGLRAASGFGVITAILLVVGIFCLIQMATLNRAANDINDVWLRGVSTVQKLSMGVGMIRLEAQRIRGTSSTIVREKSKSIINSNKVNITSAIASYKARLLSSDESAFLDTLQSALSQYTTTLERFVLLVESHQASTSEIDSINAELASIGSRLTESMEGLIKINENGSNAATVEIKALYSHSQAVVTWVLGAAVLLTVFVAWTLTKSIVVPIREAVGVAQTIAFGDLTQTISVYGKDEPAVLLNTMAMMQSNLRSTVSKIGEYAMQLTSAAEEMTSVMETSSEGLREQNAKIEQTATAVNQMSSAVDEVASNAVGTSQLSKVSDMESQKGHGEVSETITLINGLALEVTNASEQAAHLSQHADEISKVLSVIHSISDQTNLLALNAAIEAARAGEAGRGFAVVADEVRSLARRTQSSTLEIGKMISNIQAGTQATVTALQGSANMVGQTLTRAHSAGEALIQIASAASQINERNLIIASATEQQAMVAREVDASLVAIRDLSMQSAVGAHQTSNASQELARLAISLNQAVSRFAI